jgi:hypothetical protein
MLKHFSCLPILRFTVLVIITSMLAEASTQSVASGQISGSVRGPAGEALRGAIVVVSSHDGRVQRMTRTNAQGSFVFSGLAAGSYTMQSCAEPWGPSSPADVELKTGLNAIQDLPIPNATRTAEGACNPDSVVSPTPRDAFGDHAGEFMSFDLNGDITEFFRSIASVSHLELDVARSIDRKVTVHLRNVPWELALGAVLKSSGLASESDGTVLHIAPADPAKGQDRVLMGTLTMAGQVTGFNLQNPRSVLQVRALNGDGAVQVWPVEWESADYLKELGITPNAFKSGDHVIVTGNFTRTNSIRLISIRRPVGGFSWGYPSAVRVAPFDGVMFVSSQ